MKKYLFKKIVFNCKHATLLSLKKEEGSITPLERIKLAYHLSFCTPCKKFIEQSSLINSNGKSIDKSIYEQPPHTLSQDLKNIIQQKLDKAAK